MVNCIIEIIGDESIPSEFIGRKGIVTGRAYNDKWFILFEFSTSSKGSLSHTAKESDFVVISKCYEL